MLERLFRRASVRRRMAAGHLGIILVRFALDLEFRGYARTSLQSYVQITEHFSRWLAGRGLTPGDLDEGVIERFLRGHLPHCRCPWLAAAHPRTCRAALGCLLRFMREHDWASPASPPAPSASEHWVEAYDQYLEEVAGLAAGTRHYRRRYARDFLMTVRGSLRHGAVNLSSATVERYVERRACRLKPASVRVLASSLRSFLGFLAGRGRVDARLAAAVPHPAPWPVNPPPQVLSRGERRAFLACFDRRTAVGRRDYAMAMLMAQLGLRCHEVAALTVEDLDGQHGALRLRQTKQRRERVVPWTRGVARAISAYLRHGRPSTSTSALFVRHRAPRGSPLCVHHVRGAMRRAFARAGIKSGKIHLLRHTLATRLHSAGVDLKRIADLLGHQSLDTTLRYARVNLQQLRQATLRWPEGSR